MDAPYLALSFLFFFFNDTATTEIYTLSLHDALPIWASWPPPRVNRHPVRSVQPLSTLSSTSGSTGWPGWYGLSRPGRASVPAESSRTWLAAMSWYPPQERAAKVTW